MNVGKKNIHIGMMHERKNTHSNECLKENIHIYDKIIIKDVISDVFTVADILFKGKRGYSDEN